MKKLLLTTTMLCCLLACKTNQQGTKATTGNGQIPASFNPREIFSLSMLSNIPSSTYAQFVALDFSTDKSMRADTAIQAYAKPIIDSALLYATDCSIPGDTLKLSNWKRVWGPVVASDSNSMLANPLCLLHARAYVSTASMTIFESITNPGNYVVAIQATNPYSITDWSTYDFNVKQQQQWFYDTASSGHISQGTSLGLASIMALQDNSVSAVQFLDTVMKRSTTPTNIVVTGHSLGGALSPVFALYMQKQISTVGNGNDSVYCYSTAGATPGDTTFANYYNGAMGSHTVRIWNYYDMVPRGWDTSTLSPIMSHNGVGGLYSQATTSVFYDTSYSCNGAPSIPQPFTAMVTDSTLNKVITSVINTSNSAPVPYRYICNNGQNFLGASNSSTGFYVCIDTTESKMDSVVLPKLSSMLNVTFSHNDILFLTEEAEQHVVSYGLYYNMKGVHEYVKSQVRKNQSSACFYFCNEQFMPNPGAKDDVSAMRSHGTLQLPEKVDPYALIMGYINYKAWQY